MIPNFHFDSENPTTYIADKTTVRLLFAVATAFDIHIAHIDTKEAYLHEIFDHSSNEQEHVRQHPKFY